MAERIPLFPLGTVLFPGALLPLRIFEERYRQLLADLLDRPEPEQVFGVVAIREGREVGADGVRSLHEVGCTARLRLVEPTTDGSIHVVTAGVQRFQLLSLDPSAAPYPTARVDPLPEPLGECPPALADSVARLFLQYRAELLGVEAAVELPADTGAAGLRRRGVPAHRDRRPAAPAGRPGRRRPAARRAGPDAPGAGDRGQPAERARRAPHPLAAGTQLGSASVPGTPATVALARAKVPFTEHAYGHDPAAGPYGLEAAAALEVTPARVFKTLLARVDGALTVAVVPVSGQLDLKALAAAVGGKRAEMADPKDAERVTGYVVGGISPVGQRKALPTVVDATASGFPTVFVSGGRRGLDIELAPADLVRVTRATLAPIGRPG